MKNWITIKLVWNIAMVAMALITAIVGFTKWEINYTFYFVAIEFFIWFMVNEILQLFMPVPVPVRRK